MYARLQRLVVYLAILDLLATQAALIAADWARRVVPRAALLGSKYQGDTDPTPSRYHLELASLPPSSESGQVANGTLR